MKIVFTWGNKRFIVIQNEPLTEIEIKYIRANEDEFISHLLENASLVFVRSDEGHVGIPHTQFHKYVVTIEYD